MKVLVSEKIAEEGIQILSECADVDVKTGLSHEELIQIIGGYDALVVRSATQVNAEVIEKGVNLKVVGRAGTGVDNIDVAAATRKGIVVVNAPDGNSMAAAELAVGLAFAIFRNIPQAYAAGKKNDYGRGKFKGFELNGKTAGVIGLGRIGSLVAERLKGLNMNVIGFDPFVSDEKYDSLGITKCATLDDLLAKSDFITLHISKTPDTVNMLSEKQFKLMKKGVRIVNCARGGLINEKALYDALKDGTVAAAALDVLEKEPDFELKPDQQTYSNPLLELDNVVYLPHLGASTNEAQFNVALAVARNVAAVLKDEMVSAVNMPAVRSKDLDELKPYIDLAENLGKIYFQAEKAPISKVEIIYSGEIASKPTKIVTLAFLKGLMNPLTEDKVNYVNAPVLVKSRGIEVVESTTSISADYTNLITIRFTSKDRQLTMSGTVLGRKYVKLIDFFGYYIDFEPSPYILAIQNVDKPGVIGQIGTVLGEACINIASMQVSRNKKGEKAVAFLSVDGEVCEATLAKLREIDGVLKATMITL